jgi:Rhodopirellula transposase DDE domain
MADAELVGRMVPELDLLLPMLDERARRLVLGAVARAAGTGGAAAVAAGTGASWQTVADGAAELASGDSAPPGRVRRPGGGRKPLASTDEGLVPALRDLLEAVTRGDPMSPLRWTTLSVREIAAELARQGHRAGKDVVAGLLAAEGYSLQGNSRTVEGKRHPDRDGQFRNISGTAAEFLAAGDPVISVDTKKKEKTGRYGQDGRTWRPAGDPVRVLDHDFPRPGDVVAVPYGVYDVGGNTGFVNVGTSHDTAAFAVESIRRWWQEHGAASYPGARRLLVTADAGGSNSYRARAWKAGLAVLAAETGLEITVLHFPPGTSRWNKIEHRLFCHISRTWRGRPLTSLELILDTIAATSTAAGLTVTARLDLAAYPEGVTVSDPDWADLHQRVITGHQFHPAWNYDINPRPPARPAPPAPEPPPAPVLRPLALTVMTGQDIDALAAVLQAPFGAAREHRLHLARGRPRTKASGARGPARRTLDTCLLQAICRYQLGMTCQLIATLTGRHHSDISKDTTHIRTLLTDLGRPFPAPPPRRIRTLADLSQHATAAGITLPEPATPSPAQ